MALQTLRRQKQAIETILAENRRLRDEILEETRFGGQDGQSNRGAGEGGGANLRQLVAALEVRDLNHEAFIAQEQRAVEALIAREEELGEEIRKVRQSMGGIFNAKEQWVSRHRRIVLLENQVSQAMTGCDTLDTTVKQLVREIDGLRKEKALFDQLQGKLKRSLRLNAQHIGELLLLAFNAHKSKRRAQKLLEKVQLQTDKETAAYMEEWRQLDAVLKEDADQKERRFQTSCVQRSKRLDAVLARKRSRRKEADQSTATEATESPPGARGTNPKQRLLGIEASLAQVVKGLPGTCC